MNVDFTPDSNAEAIFLASSVNCFYGGVSAEETGIVEPSMVITKVYFDGKGLACVGKYTDRVSQLFLS